MISATIAEHAAVVRGFAFVGKDAVTVPIFARDARKLAVTAKMCPFAVRAVCFVKTVRRITVFGVKAAKPAATVLSSAIVVAAVTTAVRSVRAVRSNVIIAPVKFAPVAVIVPVV